MSALRGGGQMRSYITQRTMAKEQTLMWPRYANVTAQQNKVQDPRHKQAYCTQPMFVWNKKGTRGAELAVGRKARKERDDAKGDTVVICDLDSNHVQSL